MKEVSDDEAKKIKAGWEEKDQVDAGSAIAAARAGSRTTATVKRGLTLAVTGSILCLVGAGECTQVFSSRGSDGLVGSLFLAIIFLGIGIPLTVKGLDRVITRDRG